MAVLRSDAKDMPFFPGNTVFSWRGDRVADGAALEMLCAFTGTVGSNPTLSANQTRANSGLRAIACLPLRLKGSHERRIPQT